MPLEPRYKVGDLIHVAGGNAFRVERVLGAGGMGAVFLCLDKALDELRVMKMLHPEHARTRPDLVERFLREARAMTKIKHPNIVRVFALYTLMDEHSTPAFTMEALEGVELGEVIEKGIAPPIALHILYQILAGLDAMHQRGVVHRDIKPGNILLYRERDEEHWLVKVLDLSVIRLIADETTFEGFIGTFGYASDDQLSNKLAEPADDVWSAFLVLLEMLTGTYPFVEFGQGRAGALARVGKRPRLLREHGLDHPDIDELLEQAFSRDRRFTDAYTALKAVKKLHKKYAESTDRLVPRPANTTQERPRAQEQITEAHLSPTSPDVLPAWLEEFRKHNIPVPMLSIKQADSVVDERGPTTPARLPHETIDERLGRNGSTLPSGFAPSPGSRPLEGKPSSPSDVHRQPTALPSVTPPAPELAKGDIEYVASSHPPAPEIHKRPRTQGPKVLLFVSKTEDMDYSLFVVEEFPIILGRELPSTLLIHNGNVSAMHACIDYNGLSHVLVDLGSTNGTHVDAGKKRRRLEPHVPLEMISGAFFYLGQIGVRAYLAPADEKRFGELIDKFNRLVAEERVPKDRRQPRRVPVALVALVAIGAAALLAIAVWLAVSR